MRDLIKLIEDRRISTALSVVAAICSFDCIYLALFRTEETVEKMSLLGSCLAIYGVAALGFCIVSAKRIAAKKQLFFMAPLVISDAIPVILYIKDFLSLLDDDPEGLATLIFWAGVPWLIATYIAGVVIYGICAINKEKLGCLIVLGLWFAASAFFTSEVFGYVSEDFNFVHIANYFLLFGVFLFLPETNSQRNYEE